MNAERLLAHYERVVDAPDAIARLRRFILDLAVRGQLVPQDVNDEPASELLKRIAKEKARLVKTGELRKPRDLDSGNDLDEPFAIPVTWRWVRLDAVGAIVGGGTPPAADADNFAEPGEGVPWLPPADLGGYSHLYISRGSRDLSEKGSRASSATVMPKGTVLFTSRAPIGYVAIAANPISTNQGFKSIVPYIADCSRFIATAMRAFAPEIDANAPGTTFKEVSGKIVAAIPFPLPPLAEQHRIVAKVDELMALCDRLEAARGSREATRNRLAAASLARLNAPDPESFQADARFALDALPALTTRPDQIKQLRQTILNLAVRGKLVPQDASDGPASELLKRIAKEKARLVKEGKAKRQELQPEPDLDHAPFAPPLGWEWGRFPELGTFGRGKSKHRPRNDPALFVGGTHLMIQTGDVARSQGAIETYTSKYNDFGLSQSFKWRRGALCITIAANIADSGILGFDACFPDSVVGFVPASMFENARYFEYFVRTAKANLLEFAPATAQKNINLEILISVLIPLQPLAEQHRIVAKVDDLMALCDRLEASLDLATATRRRLLAAVLAEVLAQGESDTHTSPEEVTRPARVAAAE
ncbi:MAG: restriction endonuclease subunit S [Gammaproteobacteria bacterium]|nr:restriction endonuclease subunit S [Gammaproteobacteria bacterium]